MSQNMFDNLTCRPPCFCVIHTKTIMSPARGPLLCYSITLLLLGVDVLFLQSNYGVTLEYHAMQLVHTIPVSPVSVLENSW